MSSTRKTPEHLRPACNSRGEAVEAVEAALQRLRRLRSARLQRLCSSTRLQRLRSSTRLQGLRRLWRLWRLWRLRILLGLDASGLGPCVLITAERNAAMRKVLLQTKGIQHAEHRG